MSITIRILLFIAALFTLLYVLWKLRKERMPIRVSVFWILFAFIIVLMAIFPQIAIQFTRQLGIISPSNFIYLVFIFFAYIQLFSQSTKISRLENKIESMAYEIAKLKKNQEQKNNECLREGSHPNANRNPHIPTDQ